MLSAGFWRLLCWTDVLHFTFQSLQEAPSLPPLNHFIQVGRAELPPHHYLDKHTWWKPQTTTQWPRATEPCQAQAIKMLLQRQRHWEHRLAGRNEAAQLFLMTITAGLTQPPALAQSAQMNSKPYQVSAVVKHHMPMVWEHQFQTTESLQSPLSSEKVVSVLLPATLKH